ncbi:MAG: pyruvate, water dikinase regulatory protein [Acidimicrobiia bacterium]
MSPRGAGRTLGAAIVSAIFLALGRITMTQKERTVFCVSDHTGVTAEVIAHSLVSQFDEIDVRYVTRPFVDDAAKVQALVVEINTEAARGGTPLVFSTIIDPELRAMLEQANGLVMGLFEQFVDTLAKEFDRQPSAAIGSYHSISNAVTYQLRLDAVEYALATDDGLGLEHYRSADVIVIGVSRVGKTPTCLYLAMQYGIRAANFPLTPDMLEDRVLPEVLHAHTDRLFGLTIDPVQLFQIRRKRRPDTSYASLERCAEEVEISEWLFRTKRIPSLNTTVRSIEEITATIIDSGDLARRLD